MQLRALLYRRPSEPQSIQVAFDRSIYVVRVRRHRSISLDHLDEAGRLRRWQSLPPDLAELLQHEIDHLDGVLILDRTSREQRKEAMRTLREAQQAA